MNQGLFSNEFLNSHNILDWGYTEESIPRSLSHYEQWANKSWHEPLVYMGDHRLDARRDLKKVYPKFQSAMVFLFSYQETKKWMLDNDQHHVAAYALGFEGEDYHHALKRKLQNILDEVKKTYPEAEGFLALDAQPVLERDLAHRAGLGWFGKNSMLIHQKHGSHFIIGSILLNQKFNIEEKIADIDHCGQCMACVEACPTDAIDPETRTLKAAQCLSTFTIEIFKAAEPPAGYEKSRGEIFGCDICQDVCPWSKKSLLKVSGKFFLKENYHFLKSWLFEMPKQSLYNVIDQYSNRGFKKQLNGSPFDRPGREGWLKNLKALLSTQLPK